VRRFSTLLCIFLVIAACGDDDAASTTLPLVANTSADTTTTTASVDDTTAAQATSPTSTAPSTEAPITGPTDCLEIWPEVAVQAVAGTEYTFFQANDDRSACTYFNMPNGIALAWRTGDRAGFEASQTGAGVVSGSTDITVCDVGFYTEIQGAVLIMEAHSDAQSRTYTATMSGLESDDAKSWAASLLGSAC